MNDTLNQSMETPPPKPTKLVPWHPLLAILLVVLLYFVASFLAGLIIAAVPLALGWSVDRINTELSNSTAWQFSYVLSVEVITLGGLALFLRQFKTSWKVIGLKRPRLKDVGIGALAYPVYFVAFLALVLVAPHFLPGLNLDQEQELGFDNVAGALPLILTFLSLVVLPPIVEEIVFRGFLFTSMRRWSGFLVAALITSFIFALFHLPEGGSSGPLYIAALDTFILSLVLCYVREKTGSLWASITLHAIKNGVAYASLFIFTAH